MLARIVSLVLLPIGLCGWLSPAAAVETSQSFVAPVIKDFRLDWCRNWGVGCGGPAAELFCREKGFDKATRWSIDPNVGARGIPTLVFGDGRLCQAPNCSGFRVIVCARVAAAAPPKLEVKPPTTVKKIKVKPAPTVELPKIVKKPVEVDTKRKVANFKFTKFSSFKPRKPEAVRLTWINTLRVLNTYPAGASLYKCGSGDCSVSSTADLQIDDKAAAPTVDLTFSASAIPHAEKGLWQVSYLPFPAFANASAADLTPPGLVLSGETDYPQGWFSFSALEAAKKLPAGAREAIFHIRVLPVAGESQIVGQPTNVMRAFYGVKLPPQEPYKIYTKSEVPGSAPDIRLVKLEVEPFKSVVDAWPPGCKTWEETYGEDKNIFEEIGEFLSGAWNWASDAYQWAKDQVIELASILTLGLIPKDVFVFALDAAMASMGIPPDIPNLGQLMNEGVDGLAKEMAKAAMTQIPAADLASNVGNLAADLTIETAAAMTEEELRKRLELEIEKRSHDAILAAANEMQKQLATSGKGKLCTNKNFHSVFKVTVVNAGNKDEPEVRIRADAEPVYYGGGWTIAMRRGEQLTLVGVGKPILPSGPYSWPWLTAKQRFDEDMARWWQEVLHYKAIFSVNVTGVLKCLDGDPSSQFCDREMKNLHRSAPQKVLSAYSFSQ
ncbi:MAG: hypothetical protein ACREDN_02915 [Aestuariivirga sp.]